jgi:hypothetical protein
MLRRRPDRPAGSATGLALTLVVAVLGSISCGRAAPSPETTGGAENLAALLPSSDEIPGWSRTTAVDSYGPDTLYEYINGQAPFYLDYGFQEVITAEYTADEGVGALAVELFRMGTPEQAFGIFAAERSEDDQSLDVGAQAYAGSNVVGFWKGVHYVKVTSFVSGVEVAAALIRFAELASARVPGEVTLPPLFDLFPREGRVDASERFIPKDVLGQTDFRSGYLVDYARDDDAYRMVLIDSPTAADAQRSLNAYALSVENRGSTVTVSEEDGQPLVTAIGDTVSVLFQRGNLIGGTLEVNDPALARRAALDLMARCPRSP